MTKAPQGRSTLRPLEPSGAPHDRSRFARNMMSTIPIVLAGSMAMTFGMTPAQGATPRAPETDKGSPSELTKSIRHALAAAHSASSVAALAAAESAPASVAPAAYTVVSGDTVSGIAGRYGLATASVLALNGLGWKSMIHPGQVLRLTSGSVTVPAPQTVSAPAGARYTIVSGDTIGKIAAKFGVTTAALLSSNGLGFSSTIYAGSSLAIPPRTSPAGVSPATPATPAPRLLANVTPAPAATSHVIKSGETIAGIASSYGVSIQSVLAANGLGWSSIIYSGRTLTIPAVPVVVPAAPGVTALSAEMATNARTIIRVGKSLGVGDYGLVIALATAMQESSLRNIHFGDRDSLGLFQQRPSKGWGTPAQVTDPTYASRAFFGGPTGPNNGVANGLLDITGWQSKSVTAAAQAVQRSAYPDAYAKWEASARAWLDHLT